MRATLVHGRKSITCATSVLPAFTMISQDRHAREIASKNDHETQIDTRLFQPQTRMATGFESNFNHIYRTVARVNSVRPFHFRLTEDLSWNGIFDRSTENET